MEATSPSAATKPGNSINVVVGSTNPVKIASVARSFASVYPEASARGAIVVVGVSAPSGISDQPMTCGETKRGAQNRAIAAAKKFTEDTGTAPNFAVGLEGGCQQHEESCDDTTGDATSQACQMECFAWMAVLQPSSGRWGSAKTGTFMLPPAVAALVAAGVELGTADDMVFGRTNSKQQDGAVGLLSKGLMDRTAYYEHAMVLALIPFISEAYYWPPATGSSTVVE